MQRGLNSCRTWGQTSFYIGSQQIPKHSFFQQKYLQEISFKISWVHTWGSKDYICTHTSMLFMPELLIQSRNGNAIIVCGSFTQMLPNTTTEIQNSWDHYDRENIQKMHDKNSNITLKKPVLPYKKTLYRMGSKTPGTVTVKKTTKPNQTQRKSPNQANKKPNPTKPKKPKLKTTTTTNSIWMRNTSKCVKKKQNFVN